MNKLEKVIGASILGAVGMLGIKGDTVRSVFGMEKQFEKPAVYATNEPEAPAVNPEPEAPKEPPAVSPEEPAKEPAAEPKPEPAPPRGAPAAGTPPGDEPKVEAKQYVASYRIEVAEGLGGMARAYLTALKEARTQHNKAYGSKKYISTTPSGDAATFASMTDMNKDGKTEASELEEACNQLEKEMDLVKKFTKDKEYEGKDHSRLKIEAKFEGDDYIEAKIEIPSIAQESPEAARLDAVRELMKKTGNEHKFVNLCEQYNTTLAKDGKFDLEGFEKYAQKKYGDTK